METTKRKENGAVVWQGISPFDGAPIALIMTGLDKKGSMNPKTGKMIQTWILRTDVEPQVAVKTGQDASICGNCPHRRNPISGKRSCYVFVSNAPLTVYRKFHRGGYADLTGDLKSAQDWLKEVGRRLRIGSYGDPAMVPFEIWETLLKGVPGHTGYTHQSQENFFDNRFLEIAMISREQGDAITLPAGARSFRTITSIDQKASNEVLCPATPEGGNKTNCAACGLCQGASKKAKNVALLVHGINKSGFTPLAVAN